MMVRPAQFSVGVDDTLDAILVAADLHVPRRLDLLCCTVRLSSCM